MQSANLTAACSVCWIWAWVGDPPALDDLTELDELAEFEPQAAITAAAAMAAAAAWSLEAVLDMPHVVSRDTSHECNTRGLIRRSQTPQGVVMAL